MTDDVLIPAEEIETYLGDLLKHLGLSQEDAALCAADLVQTNLWGVDSHGLLRLPIYAQRLITGAVNRRPNMQRLGGRGGFEVWDGDAALGYVAGHRATDRAIELARSNGIGAVAIRNSNHFGAAGLYIKQAVDAGMVAIAMTNVIPNLVVPGGAKPITGNNPLAFGAPSGLDFPMILDISMSAVAGGKLLLAQKKGEKIPLGWATDQEGRPTDDPFVGFKGFLLPLGGHKGFGMSLMVDILCGVISGGAFQFDLKSMYSAPDAPSDTSHTFIVLDPDVFLGRAAFEDRMQSLYATLKASPMWEKDSRMLLPGELEHETMCKRRRDGIPVPRALLNDIRVLANSCDFKAAPLGG
ncbi:Ldh family oxidoreductase [Marinovum sp. 2_MG-2023]|uniref:Ldh family oxidoreductase n=1 Tax=unclassified Marinovum TaxID=2647166 RepID=UPI0026E2F250|nr:MULTISPECIES: Ldh family oxidoreductase [unclassified Marinovum]MDO6729266.1 Ldh family oxidoreductase [Marinovum sp. 2_MG-2023]MDO6779107.1 Ldh family oxidoreductase [Marinovum sp. 1_MG-2023]